MRIAVLGSGQVGRSLGAGLARHGHEVTMGSRDPAAQHVVQWCIDAGDRASSATYAEASAACELACLVTSWAGTENALQLASPGNLAGKVVVDVTNPLGNGPQGPRLVIGLTDSGGEQVQRWLPEARVVKAWNQVNHAHMVDPTIPGGPGDMFVCGNDPEAKGVVAALLAECGWPSVDVGAIDSSRYLEPLAMLWVTYAIAHGEGDHAFKLLRP